MQRYTEAKQGLQQRYHDAHARPHRLRTARSMWHGHSPRMLSLLAASGPPRTPLATLVCARLVSPRRSHRSPSPRRAPSRSPPRRSPACRRLSPRPRHCFWVPLRAGPAFLGSIRHCTPCCSRSRRTRITTGSPRGTLSPRDLGHREDGASRTRRRHVNSRHRRRRRRRHPCPPPASAPPGPSFA